MGSFEDPILVDFCYTNDKDNWNLNTNKMLLCKCDLDGQGNGSHGEKYRPGCWTVCPSQCSDPALGLVCHDEDDQKVY
jgi:hypothetical protein